jgi:hypothetical protein
MISYLFTGGIIRQTCTKKLRDSTTGETKRKTAQKHRIHKIENENTKQITNMKRMLKT